MTSTSPSRPTRVRYAVIGVTALMSVLLYLDRFCISFAEIFIKEDLGLTDVQVGFMLSAFFWTYALGQVPSGWLTDRFGSRIMLTLYVVLWSLFTGLTGAAFGFAILLLLRFGFGFAQSGAYPTGASIISKWVPFDVRGTASSIVSVGGRVGGFLAFVVSGPLIVWLTPIDTPAEIDPRDILDPPQLCYALSTTDMKPAARVTAKVVAALPADVRQLVTRYGAEQANYNATYGNDSKSGRAGQGSAATFVNVPEDDVIELAAGMSGIVKTRGIFTADDVATLELESEAQRLLAADPAALEDQQVQRLNRLVLEAAYRDSLRKIYGAGWRPMMFIYGGLGMVVGGLVWWTCRNRPSEHPTTNAAEVALIEDDPRMAAARQRGKVGAPPLNHMLTNRSLWLVCLSQWCTNVGWVFIMTWAPRYFETVHQVPIEKRAVMVAIPPLVGWFGMLLGGVLTDRLVRVVGLRWGRVLPMSLTRFVAMGAYLVCLFEPSPWLAVFCFSLVAFFTDCGTPAIWSFNQDVGGRHVGSILGWGNMWGNLGAAVTPPLLIWIVGTSQNWTAAFLTCAAAFLLSGLAALGVDPTRPIVPEDDKPTSSIPNGSAD